MRAFAAANAPDTELVCAGGGAGRESLGALAAELGVGARVRFVGYVPDADLPGLYAGALGFAYPSEYEGFGLQLVESMASGCPTLASDRTCLPEILGDGGETFPLETPDRLADQLRRLAADPHYRADLAARGRRRAEAFSWAKCAAETRAVYEAARQGAARPQFLEPRR